ncbi:hypothetical protein QJQ45_023868 [Haematococcus lacustris]|nr:hypothetical protein QJQ45_023868 [Haematococcus lacustris]
MFKKHMPALGVEGKVSGADRKKLRRALEKLFVQLTEDCLEAVLPSKAGDLVMVKLAAPRREVLYRLDGCPLFIDISGKMELVPTVFALWRAPTMLPQLHVKHSAVSQFLVGGADLMLPGVLIPASGLPAFEREQLVSEGEGVGGADTQQQPSAGAAGGPEDMDDLLETVLLQALHKSVKDDALPLSSSVLWSQHMQPVRPASSTLDLKRSRHKKLSSLLKAYAGKGGLLALKEDKKTGDQVVTAINRQHPLYDQYKPYRSSLSAAAAAATNAGGGGEGGGGEGVGGEAGAPGGSSQVLVVEELWKPGRELKPVLEAVGLGPDGLYTAAQIREAGFAYVKAAGLGDKSCDPQSLQLDVLLCDALFHGLVKKGELYPTHLAKADLAAAMTRRCSAQASQPAEGEEGEGEEGEGEEGEVEVEGGGVGRQTLEERGRYMEGVVRIQRGAQSLIKKGAVPAISVSVVKRQGSKKVTRVVGMEAFLVSPEELAAESQRKFAASSSVNELPGKSGGVEVVVQGSVAEQMAALLTDRYGIPKKYISVKTEA